MSLDKISKRKWYADNMEQQQYTHDGLNEQSIVFDIGAYTGQYSKNIYKLYKCKIFGFEPNITNCDKYNKYFENISDVTCYNFALGAKDDEFKLYTTDHSVSASAYNIASSFILCKIKSYDDFIHEHNINVIDLMAINIEGSEYDLLDYLLENNRINKIKNLQIQFHKNVKNCVERRDNIIRQLQQTHVNIYNYPFCWELWRCKD